MTDLTNIPQFSDERVKCDRVYDYSNKRNLYHTARLLIDEDVVYTEQWYEDDDWDSRSELPPSCADMWDKYIESLGLEPKNYRKILPPKPEQLTIGDPGFIQPKINKLCKSPHDP